MGSPRFPYFAVPVLSSCEASTRVCFQARLRAREGAGLPSWQARKEAASWANSRAGRGSGFWGYPSRACYIF